MVLVIVLWVLMLLAVMAGNLTYTVRIDMRLATHAMAQAQTRAAAEAGITYAVAWQTQPTAARTWPANGVVRTWMWGEVPVQVAVTSAAGLINLNTAPAEHLRTLFQAVGVPEEEAKVLAEAVLTARGQGTTASTPSDKSRAGAQTSVVDVQGRHFASVEALQHVPGITQALYDNVRDALTVYGEHTQVSLTDAPVLVLRALGLQETAIDALLRNRAEGAVPSTVSSRLFHITATAETVEGVRTTMRAVYAVQQGKVRWLSYREGP